MKATVAFFILITFCSCNESTNDIHGTWTVDSKFYRATCNITETNDAVKGQVLYYNDDTTVYTYNEGEAKNYFFNNIKVKNGGYVDAISGATKTGEQLVTLKLRHKDTLDITRYVMNKPLKETWIRIK